MPQNRDPSPRVDAPKRDQNPLASRLIGVSRQTKTLRQQIRLASQHQLTVLLEGETGTGKEVVARLLHDLSPRAHGPFIAINCAAIPESLIESELFGFQKGAFSGALQHQTGLLAQAHGGTLFLDEVGDMPLPMQAKLLRVLESRHYRPLGSGLEKHADFRLVAATHQPLAQRIDEQRFRADLYHRMCQFQIHLVPLRERSEDISPLCHHFLQLIARQQQRRWGALEPTLLHQLEHYAFPGNVRELRNLLEVLCAHTAEGNPLGLTALPEHWQHRLANSGPAQDEFHHIRDLGLALRLYEAGVIGARLNFYQGHRGRTAASLGLPKRTLDHKCQKLEMP